jgi:hypothetical protein
MVIAAFVIALSALFIGLLALVVAFACAKSL